MDRHLFTSRASMSIWRWRPSCWTEAPLRLMRRILMARLLFTSRAAKGIWRSRPSCWTEEALRLMRRIKLATHLFTSRGVQNSPDSCWTVGALLTSKSPGEADPTLEKFSSFCRSEVTTCFLTLHLRRRNDAGSASSSVALPFVVFSATFSLVEKEEEEEHCRRQAADPPSCTRCRRCLPLAVTLRPAGAASSGRAKRDAEETERWVVCLWVWVAAWDDWRTQRRTRRITE